MSYIENNLMPNEYLVHEGKVHWFIFVPSVAMFIIGSVINSGASAEESPAAWMFAALLITFALFSFVKAVLFKISTELAVTNKRVIAKVGFIRRSTIELNHNKVESFNIDQSIFGRIFGFGTVIVGGTGGGKTPIPSIVDPMEFRKQVMCIVDEDHSSS